MTFKMFSSEKPSPDTSSLAVFDPKSAQQHPSVPLPLAFNVYCDKSRFTYYHFYIGPEKKNQLNLFEVRYKKGVHTTVALHENFSADSPTLGSTMIQYSSCYSVDINLPADPTSGHGAVNERMSGHHSWGHSKYTFSLPLAEDGSTDQLPERFEWRHSDCPEVKQLGGRGKGWKLIRLSGEAEEIVAVWSVDLCSWKLSGEFQFLGSGATGELGRVWALMAVLTGFSIGQITRTQAQTAAVVAASA